MKVPKITAQGCSRRAVPSEVKHEATRTTDTRTLEKIDRETQSDHIENYGKGDRTPLTPVIIRPTDGPAPLQYKVHQDAGDMSMDGRRRGPIVLVAGATSSDKKQLRGPGTRLSKQIQKEIRRNGPIR